MTTALPVAQVSMWRTSQIIPNLCYLLTLWERLPKLNRADNLNSEFGMIVFQNCALYTEEDRAVWRLLYERQVERLQDKVCHEYFGGLRAVGLTASEIPSIGHLNANLEPTGWQTYGDDGCISGTEYLELISKRKFPLAISIRSKDELVHSKLPDMFHDTFGHLPLLIVPDYRQFVEEMGRLAMQRPHDIEWLNSVSRAYKWTIEFGVIRTKDGLRVYGAGLISSSEELDYVLSSSAVKVPFTAEAVLSTPHTPAALQRAYFVIESFSQLRGSIARIEGILQERFGIRPSPVVVH